MKPCFYCGRNHNPSACIIHSQDMTKEAINHMSNEITRSSREIADGFNDISDIFNYHHAEKMWELQQQTNVLKEIRDELREISNHWSDKRANEELEKGAKFLKLGKIKASLTCLQKGLESNPADYRICITMGHAYLRIDDSRNALYWFEEALEYAPTKYYES